MFECDVKLSADGVPFLLHDSTLDRTTDGHGTAGDQTWAALAALDAGSWHSAAFAGERLATLDAVAQACLANGWLLNIEIKPTPGTEAHTGMVVANAAAALWASAAVPPLLSSFQPLALAAAQQAQPQLPRGLLLDALPADWLDTAQRLACEAVICQQTLWTADAVAQARAAGFRMLSYTVNDAASVQRLQALGTDGFITDRVDRFSPGP
jgi:glycerophosphoryl diester phosphodiesterase